MENKQSHNIENGTKGYNTETLEEASGDGPGVGEALVNPPYRRVAAPAGDQDEPASYGPTGANVTISNY